MQDRRRACALATSAAIAATALGAVQPPAASAAPTVNGPGRASITAGRPEFALAAGPAGEQVSEVVLATRASVAADGRLDVAADRYAIRLPVAAGQATVRTPAPLRAGRWSWQAWWASVDGSATPATTAVGSFVVPAWVRALRGSYVQMTETPAFTARGSVATNVRTAVATCSLHDRSTVVARSRITIRPNPARRTGFRCPGLRVPERLDGRTLTLRVSVGGSSRSIAASTRFVAS